MISYGANLGLMVNAATGEVHDVALRAFLRGLDALVMPVVKGVGTNTPPGSPSDGDAYVVGTSPTGSWAGKNNQIARWTSVANAWEFYVPKAGWRVVDSSATGQPQYTYTGSSWTTLITTAGGINFGDTDLKNYQEGTFTPTIGLASGSVGYSKRLGRYTRVGRMVHSAIRIILNSVSSPTGSLYISGLPFTTKGDGIYTPATVGVGSLAGISYVWACVVPDNDRVYLYGHAPSSGYAFIPATALQSNSEISLAFSYEV